MVRACLSGAEVDHAVPAFVAKHSDGLPFLIEELLAGLVTSGALIRDDGRWRAEQAPIPSVPVSFAASLGTRLQTLDPDARHVLAAAAVLGRRFDWDLLPVSRRSTARLWSGRCVEPSTPSSSPWTASGSGSATLSPARPCSPSCCHRSGPSCPGGR